LPDSSSRLNGERKVDVEQRNIVASQLHILLSSIGRKRGSAELLSLLLKTSDLENLGYRVTRNRSWRNSKRTTRSPEGLSSHDKWGISASRNYKTSIQRKAFFIQITPYDTPEEASIALPKMLPQFAKGLLMKVISDTAGTQTTETKFGDVAIRDSVHSVALIHRVFRIHRVAGVIDNFLLAFEFSSLAESWSLDDILLVLELQATKIDARK
jgi:hypothetical protein